MAEPTIQLGNGNWAGKTDNLLGYYKEGERFYKQDFTFSRSTTGTYTDSDGYIQEMPYNLLQYSEDFSQGVYVKNNTSVTSGFTSPNNTNNAFKFVENNANSTHSMYNNVVNGIGDFTISMFAKSAERSKVRITNGTTSRKATFNLSNATISDEAGVSASMVSFGNGWYRCIITYNTTSVNDEYFNINIANNLGDFAYQGDGSSGLYIYGAQLNKGTSAKTYFPTTTRLNMPRVDYLNSSKGSLILEPQRTNLLPYSEDFSDSSWVKTNCNITSNNSTSPEGVQNATKLDFTTASGEILRTTSVTSGQQYTLSFYAKTESGTLDFNFGSISFATVSGTATTEWQRFEIVQTAASSTRYPKIQTTEIGSLLLWGAQVEQGSYATSYIPTSGSSVTRNADMCSLSNIADRIGQTEGTIYVDVNILSILGNEAIVGVNSGGYTNHATIQRVGNTIQFVRNSATQSGATIVTSSAINIGSHKIAIAYKSGDTACFLNGTQVSTTQTQTFTNGTLNTLRLGADAIGSIPINGLFNNAIIYSQRLSNTELATLTT